MTDTLLDELKVALALPVEGRGTLLNQIRRTALDASNPAVAALCLHYLAEMEWDLDRRAEMRARVAHEYPTVLAFESLAETYLALGDLSSARVACNEALRLKPNTPLLCSTLSTIDEAIRGKPKALAFVCALRAQTESDLAIIGSRKNEEAAYARLRRQRRKALKAKDHHLAMLLLRGMVAVAVDRRDSRQELRFARRLVAENMQSWTLEVLGAAQERGGDLSGAAKTYRRAHTLALAAGDDQAGVLERKIENLSGVE